MDARLSLQISQKQPELTILGHMTFGFQSMYKPGVVIYYLNASSNLRIRVLT